jgi:hypothetical protein
LGLLPNRPRCDDNEMRRASPDDVPLLVDLMAEFYAETGYELYRERAVAPFATMFANEGTSGSSKERIATLDMSC